MLYHHDGRGYEEAASSAAKAAKEKLFAIIDKGKANAMATVEQIYNDVPNDKIVKGHKVLFETVETSPGNFEVRPNVDGEPMTIHTHAFAQVRERLHMPAAWSQFLVNEGPWGVDKLARDMNEVMHHLDSRYLVRSVRGQVRGWLSDQYRRLDSRPLLDTFVTACQSLGLVPTEGYALDTKVALKAMLPVVFEPAPNEVIAFGLKWGNSDFGSGKHNLHAFVLRLWCTNYAIAEDALSQVHLGGRLPEDLALSEETYALDTKTSASAMKDLVGTLLSPERVKAYLGAVKECHEKKIDPARVAAEIRKRFDKSDAERILHAFESPDTYNMPEGQNMWRMSNAVSWIAGKTEDREKGLDMMRYAGELLKLPALRK